MISRAVCVTAERIEREALKWQVQCGKPREALKWQITPCGPSATGDHNPHHIPFGAMTSSLGKPVFLWLHNHNLSEA